MHISTTTPPVIPEPYSPEDDPVSETRLKAVPEAPDVLEPRTYVVCPDCNGYVRSTAGEQWEQATPDESEITRADLATVFRCRPCLFITCHHHLYTDVNPKTGSLKLNFPDRSPEELEYSCALDLADEGPQTLQATAQVLNMGKDRTRQIESIAVEKLKGLAKARARELVDFYELAEG
jgi:hypothetical protein